MTHETQQEKDGVLFDQSQERAEIRKMLAMEKADHARIVETQNKILEKVLKHEAHIDAHTSHLEGICESIQKIEKTLLDFSVLGGLADNIQIISKFGKLVRIVLIWLAGAVGAATVLWVSFRDGFNK